MLRNFYHSKESDSFITLVYSVNTLVAAATVLTEGEIHWGGGANNGKDPRKSNEKSEVSTINITTRSNEKLVVDCILQPGLEKHGCHGMILYHDHGETWS